MMKGRWGETVSGRIGVVDKWSDGVVEIMRKTGNGGVEMMRKTGNGAGEKPKAKS